MLSRYCIPIMAAVVGFAAACSSDEPKEPKGPGKAEVQIVSFGASPLSLRAGETATISWTTEHAKSVTITDGSGAPLELGDEEPSAGSVSVTLQQTTSFELVAVGERAGDEARRSLEIVVVEEGEPRIDRFAADASIIDKGSETRLSWETTDATRVILSAGDEVIVDTTEALSGEAPITPTETTTYTLRAENALGGVEAQTTVEVRAPTPVIQAFGASPEQFDGGAGEPASITLSWQIEGATSFEIEAVPAAAIDLDGMNPEGGEVIVQVEESTTFHLVATNDNGSVTAQAMVRAVGRPSILHFTASAERVSSGENIILSWETQDATSLKLFANDVDQAINPTPGLGSIGRPLTETTTFVLEAKGEYGEARAELTIEVVEPAILAFTVDHERVAAGVTLAFAWQTEGGASVSLLDEAGDAVPGCTTSDAEELADGGCEVEAPEVDAVYGYTLQLQDAEGGVLASSTLEVEVRGGPKVLDLVADPAAIHPGESTTISWTIDPSLDDVLPTLTLVDQDDNVYDVGEILHEGSTEIVLSAVGTYVFTFTASTGDNEPSSRTVTVDVLPEPTATLEVEPTHWSPLSGEQVFVSWTTTDAESVELFEVDGDGTAFSLYQVPAHLVAEGDREVFPLTLPTTYRVVATSAAGGKATAEATLLATGAEIVSFTASPQQVAAREETTLSWEASDAIEATLEPTFGGTLAPFIDVSSNPSPFTFGTTQCYAGDFDNYYDRACQRFEFPAGFVFPFDGVDRTQLWVHHTGVISFDATTTSTAVNNAFPTAAGSSWVHLAPFWDSLTIYPYESGVSPQGKLHVGSGTDTRGDYVVVQWKNFWFTNGNDNDAPTNLTFEVVLYADGSFDYRYQTMSSSHTASVQLAMGSSATIGFQTPSGDALTISHNTAFPGGLTGFGFTFRPPNVPTTGSWTVVPLEDTTYTLTVSNGVLSSTETVDVSIAP